MANNRLSMRKITEALRLHFECDRSHGRFPAPSARRRPLSAIIFAVPSAAGLSYPLPEGLGELPLERGCSRRLCRLMLFGSEPDWVWVHREMRKKSVTLDLLWQEYKAQPP